MNKAGSIQMRTSKGERKRFTDAGEAIRALIKADGKGALYSNLDGSTILAKGFLPKN